LFVCLFVFFFPFPGALFLFLQCSLFLLSTGSHLHKQPTCKLAYIVASEDYKFVTELNLGAQIK
jgi:hypothetical protein